MDRSLCLIPSGYDHVSLQIVRCCSQGHRTRKCVACSTDPALRPTIDTTKESQVMCQSRNPASELIGIEVYRRHVRGRYCEPSTWAFITK